jgi:uncharacterized protein (TIGR02265 family)
MLSGALDPESWLAAVPAEATVKGLFPHRTLQQLGEKEFERLAPRMLRAPKLGKFLPFGDYPVRDAMRLGLAVAARAYPALPLREAFRRHERGNVTTFAESVAGGVMLSLTGSVEGALLKVPAGLSMMSRFGSAEAHAEGAGVRLAFRGKPSWCDTSAIGILEGVVQHFGATPTLTLTVLSSQSVDILVTWR